MKAHGFSAAIVFSLTLSSCSVTIPQPTAEESIQSLANNRDLGPVVDSVVQPLIDLKRNVGIVVGVITPQGEHIWVYEDPATAAKEGHLHPNTVFQIGSVTKAFTTSLLAELVGEGRLTLDEPISKAAPALKFDSESTASITLAQLASHSSGLPRQPFNLGQFWRAINYLVSGANVYKQLDEQTLIDFIAHYSVNESDKNHYFYSQVGMAFLGYCLGQVDQKGYSRLVQEKLITPLEMNDTVFTLSSDQQSRLAQAHAGDVPPFFPRNVPMKTWDDIPEGFRAAGGFYSTVPDLMKFLRANMGLTHPELQAAFKLAHTPITATKKGHIGLAWFSEVLPYAKEPYLYSDGVSSGYTSFVGYSEQYKIGVVVLQNSINFDDKVGATLLDRIVGARKRGIEPQAQTIQ